MTLSKEVFRCLMKSLLPLVSMLKKDMFSIEERTRFIEEAFADEPKVSVVTYEGLTIDLCQTQSQFHPAWTSQSS